MRISAIFSIPILGLLLAVTSCGRQQDDNMQDGPLIERGDDPDEPFRPDDGVRTGSGTRLPVQGGR